MQKDEANKIIKILKRGKQFTMEDIEKLSQLPYVGPPRVTEDKVKAPSKRANRIQALASARIYDPPTYIEFLSDLDNTPLTKIKRLYGEAVAEDTRDYFIKRPSPRFLWIQNGCVGPEPKVR